jgi:hypothetical protein
MAAAEELVAQRSIMLSLFKMKQPWRYHNKLRFKSTLRLLVQQPKAMASPQNLTTRIVALVAAAVAVAIINSWKRNEFPVYSPMPIQTSIE